MAGHIFIYGGIGTDVRQHEISAEDVRNQIDQNKAESELIVHIISPGGDVFEGEAIYNALKNSGKTIITHVEGTCASIATLIAAAGEKIIMNKTARFMIHNPMISGLNASADSRELRHVADQLDQIKTLLINVYDSKTSLGKEKLWELYDNETWLTADEAKQMGFIDESVDAIKAVAKVDLKKIEMENKVQTLWTKVMNLIRFKNDFQETLQDGTAIIVISEDENWTGKQVVTVDGAPLADGEHVLASGKKITVSGGVISAVTEATAQSAGNTELDNKIKELETALAEAKAEKDTATTNAATAQAAATAAEAKATAAEARAVKFENRTKAIEKEFLALKEELGITVGDTQDPVRGPVIVNLNDKDKQVDHMGNDVLKFLKNRNGN